jgi:CheY-like chemotaxis protein
MKDIIKDTKDMKLLYVEDNKDTRESTLLVLQNLFDNIFVAKNGQEGLELFEENSDIDIVITDINMPVKNGFANV